MKKDISRFVICIACNGQFYICSNCDHGNIYCGSLCALNARKNFTKLACQRYQNTFKGRQNHALRQKRYCARKNKVTHQGSKAPLPCASLIILKKNMTKDHTREKTKRYYCNFCGKCCSEFVRQGYLRQKPTVKEKSLNSRPQAP